MAFVELPVFPRREKAFKLQLYDRTSALVAELNVPNPMCRDCARWQSEALPVTRCLGERSVSHRPPLTGFSWRKRDFVSVSFQAMRSRCYKGALRRGLTRGASLHRPSRS